MQTLKLTKKYETYPEYKDSGVEWLGEIPKDWEISKPRKFISQIESGIWGDDPKQDNNDIKCLRVADFNFDKLTFSNVETIRNNPSLKHKKILRKGDILLEKSGGGEKTPVGRAIIFNSEEEMVCANFVDIVRVKKEIDSKFFTYQLYTSYNSKINIKSIKQNTGIQNLDIRSYFSEFYPLPEFRRQLEIVKFLDEKTSSVDQTIERKQKLIELLREKRTAIINHAVTKGLDPKAELVESGVGWIGKIPKNWQMRKLFHLFKTIGSGTTPDERYLTDSENGVPWVNTGDLKDSYIELPSKKVKPEALQECSALKLFSKDAVVIAMYGATIGKLGIPRFDFCTNQACCVLEGPSKFISEKFVYFWLLGNKKYIIEMGVGGGQPNINKDIVKSLKVSLPPKSIQDEIVEYLDKKIGSYDKAIKCVEQSIEKLKELKISIISNTVTGKIKV